MIGLAKRLTTILAFIGKELTEVVRRPGALVSLVLGPFLVMLLFGIGFVGSPTAMQAVLVVPPEADLPENVEEYASAAPGIEIVEVVPDLQTAEARLRARDVDLVIVAPDDPAEQLMAGDQAVVGIVINESDPLTGNIALYHAALFSAQLNRGIIEQAARTSQQEAMDAGYPDAARVPPELIAEPTRTEVENLVEPSVVAFYGSAMIAFVLQHLAVSLMGLSLIRERESGSLELFRVAPVSPTEIVLGKVLAFGALAAVVAVALTLLLVYGLGVPMLGNPAVLALTLGLVTAASLGLGAVVGAVSDSERQVVQVSLLVLLGSIFFTGFVLSLDMFLPAARTLTYLLPATHGISLTRDVMLHGGTSEPWHLVALGVMSVILVGAGSLLVRRRLNQS